MALNDAQRATVLSNVNADATALAFKTAGDTYSLRAWLNAEAPGPVKAWAKSVDQKVIDEATPWANFDNITQAGKRDSWLHAFFRYPRDFTKGAVRKWVTDVWGNATAGSDAATILLAAQVNANRVENFLGGTVRSTNTVSALDRNFVGEADEGDVNWLVNH